MSEGNHSLWSSISCPESLHTNYGSQCSAHAIGIWLECLDVMTRDIQPNWESLGERFPRALHQQAAGRRADR